MSPARQVDPLGKSCLSGVTMLIKITHNLEVSPTDFENLSWYASVMGYQGDEHTRIEALIKNQGEAAVGKAAIAKAEHDELWRNHAST
jgi:hypothetical protein